MPAPVFLSASRFSKPLASVAVLLLMAACAQPQESAMRYDTARENTRLDAENQALGRSPRVESQLQFGFGDTGEPERQPTAETPAGTAGPVAGADQVPTRDVPRPLVQARSFLGTVPCPSGMTCEVSRFMITLAPSGEWRARTTMLVNNQPAHTTVEQGCWDVIGDTPLRIALVHADRNTAKADMSFQNDNTLKVNSLNGVQPMLEHRLTRQADLDPIDELRDRPALACS